jgi:hypothetical protein
MGRIKKRIILLISLLLVFQQNYENYLDTIDFKTIISSPKEDFEFNLLYSRVDNIYLVFYDKKRKEIYVQFKEDRFDDLNDKIKNQFISGQPYQINIKWIGVIKDFQFIPKEKVNLLNEEEIKLSRFIFYFYKSRPLVINEFKP